MMSDNHGHEPGGCYENQWHRVDGRSQFLFLAGFYYSAGK